jgi:hypothetical protein
MHNRIFGTLIFTLMAVSLTSCAAESDELNAKQQNVQEIAMSPASITIKEGESTTIGARVSKWNASAGRTITWESSDPDIASISSSGVLYANKIGETDITASAGGKTGTCHITVVSSRVPADSVKLDVKQLRVTNGATGALSATIYPSGSTDQRAWSSSNEKVATVDATGIVTGKSNGYSTITVKAGDVSTSITVLVHGNIWLEQVDPLIKPTSFEDHPFETDTIRVARGETATVQMMVYCQSAQGTITPSITKFAQKGGSGIAITPSLHWVRSVRDSYHWDDWAGGPAPDRYPDNQILIPDALMPLEDWPVDLPKGNQTAFWAEFDIPRTCPAGIYEGTAKISGTDSGELPFVVQVYDVTLPEKQTMDVMQWISMDLSAMNNGTATDMYTVYDMIEKIIVPFVSKYGQNSFNTQYYQRYYLDQRLVKNAKGEYEMKLDFSTLENEINMYLRACPDLHYIQGGNVISNVSHKSDSGLLVVGGYEFNEDGTLKVTDNGDGTYYPVHTYVDEKGQYSKEAEAYFSLYFHALQEFLRAHKLKDGRTWLDIYLQTVCDEPGDIAAPAYERVAGYIKKGAPDIKIMDPIGTHKIGAQYIDIPCPCIDRLEGDNGYDWADTQKAWIYCCVGPQGNGLNRFIRLPLIKTRLIHWLNYRYDTVGFLHWGLNYWMGAPNGDPWKNAYGAYVGGDMWIIWPGYKKVYPSIRLAAMRDGIRDYELLRMVGAKSESEAKQICRSEVTDTFHYSTDVAKFRAARKEILEYLSGK